MRITDPVSNSLLRKTGNDEKNPGLFRWRKPWHREVRRVWVFYYIFIEFGFGQLFAIRIQ